jgi:hypothetical protein
VNEHFSHAVPSLVTNEVVSHESAGPLTVAAAGADLAAARTTCFEHLMRLKQEERSEPRVAAIGRAGR